MNKIYEFEVLLKLRHYVSSFILLIIALTYSTFIYNKVKTLFIYKKIMQYGVLPASISFGVYVIHYLIMLFFNSNVESKLFVFLLTFIFVLLLSYLTEIKIYGYLHERFVKRKKVG